MAHDEGERSETATILFSDIVESTRFRSRVGDTRANEITVAHERMIGEIVEDHGGVLVKTLGDGVLATFSGAADAGIAAQAIQSGVTHENRRHDDDEQLGVRIGISAGDVTWIDDDCHGTPVVTAARLCAAANGGQILADDLVRGLARGQTELSFTLKGELDLEGLREEVVTYELSWHDIDDSVPPLPASLTPVTSALPFAGRTAELGSMLDSWKAARTKSHRVVMLNGEPGIGKTRLASELAVVAHADGAIVLMGRCTEHLQAPLAPWIEALRHLITNATRFDLEDHVSRHGGELTKLVPELAERVAELSPRGRPIPRPSDCFCSRPSPT